MDRDTFQALLTHTGQHNLSAADTAFALVALWLARLTGQHAFAAGFIFMRRIGSAALCATGPVINVLPLAVHYDPAQPLTALAGRLAGEVKKCVAISVTTLNRCSAIWVAPATAIRSMGR